MRQCSYVKCYKKDHKNLHRFCHLLEKHTQNLDINNRNKLFEQEHYTTKKYKIKQSVTNNKFLKICYNLLVFL